MSDGKILTRSDVLQELIRLLMISEGGMTSLEEPLPQAVGQSLIKAVASFGNEALPMLHKTLVEQGTKITWGYFIDALAEVGSVESASYIIQFHRDHSSFMTGAAAMIALRKIKAPLGYEYMHDLLIKKSQGDKMTFNTGLEVVTACKAMAEWDNPKALDALNQATQITDMHGMPEAAIQALSNHAQP